MAKLYIKKFRLVADGVSYGAGSVVELPDAEAKKRAKEAPEEFEILAEPVSLEKVEETVSEKKKSKGKTAKANKEEGEELLDGLPPINMSGVVK